MPYSEPPVTDDESVPDPDEYCEKCKMLVYDIDELHIGRKTFFVCIQCSFKLAPSATHKPCATCGRAIMIMNSSTRRTKCKRCISEGK
jgi:hypothetical protein